MITLCIRYTIDHNKARILKPTLKHGRKRSNAAAASWLATICRPESPARQISRWR